MKFFAPLAAACCALLAPTALAVQEETKSIEELYADAVAEGGNLVMYHGGDFKSQQDSLHEAFITAFPEINFTLIVDYSKYHNVRIDNQLETDTLVPDLVALQTLQDFPRWAQEGKLLEYKPANFSQVYDGFRDQRGAYMAYMMFTFSFLGSSHPWEICKANVDEFPKFMADRAAVEEWKQTFTLYIGEVQGEPTPGFLGLHPGL
ncbi:hypothetical protein PR002_g913 [Phytophthora rubi]|uniref:Uncharacterized protein n=1 Tax=Phytophthora rubi TaxID=129364 RepID=A0A6A3NWN1_9STRA|nr:hypothetical protein PR002_g913 [Phytophthora rubi]